MLSGGAGIVKPLLTIFGGIRTLATMAMDGLLWAVFGVLVVIMLALDLGLFHRRARPIGFKEAAGWSVVWIALALGFAGLVAKVRGGEAGLQFLTGYIIEESLSVDNLFVFLMLFSYFAVPAEHQHSVLFWGILGAMGFRAIFIVAGVALLQQFHWVIYIFGAILIVSGVKMARASDQEIQPEKNLVLRLFRRLIPVTPDYVGGRFLVRRDGRIWATPLLLVLVVVETMDLVFAVDSIPAVLAITQDKLIVYTSNIFAIMGLRAMYFALKGVMGLFHRLHYGLCAILVLIGLKMLLAAAYPIPTGLALGAVGGILAAAVASSLLWPKKA